VILLRRNHKRGVTEALAETTLRAFKYGYKDAHSRHEARYRFENAV
jgi:hypothetical protein